MPRTRNNDDFYRDFHLRGQGERILIFFLFSFSDFNHDLVFCTVLRRKHGGVPKNIIVGLVLLEQKFACHSIFDRLSVGDKIINW